MATFTLTDGADTVTGGAAEDTVRATSVALNAGDSLTGGAGTDVLALVGSGTFDLSTLAQFCRQPVRLRDFIPRRHDPAR